MEAEEGAKPEYKWSHWETIDEDRGLADVAAGERNVVEAPGDVLLFYKYVDVPDANAETIRQAKLCQELGLRGRVRVASEGINGTLGGTKQGVEEYKRLMDEDSVFCDIHWKEAPGGTWAFENLRVRKCEEIVSLGNDIVHVILLSI